MSNSCQPTVFSRRVAYHETDAMGIAHHSNYIKFFEEGRVHWLRENKLIGIHRPVGPFSFAVVSLDCKFLKTVRFDDPLEIWVEGCMDKARIRFRYAVWNESNQYWAATGHTDLVPLNDDNKPMRLPQPVLEILRAQVWGAAWPPERRT